MLFVPVFPGGEEELNKVLLRSLKFFWPKNSLKITFLVDEDLPPAVRDPFADRIRKSMEKDAKSVHVKFNRIPRNFYSGRGHDRQQLIMFWADNFTDAEYVGFLDDDALITNHVIIEDIFDERGRPHVFGRSNFANDRGGWLVVGMTSSWTDNSQKEVMRTMNYFPVVVKTSHLKDIRGSILKHHPEFTCFDDFFRRGIMQRGRIYSQFNIMHQHLWKMKNEDYNWHLEATSPTDSHFKNIKDVTNEMTIPVPRCALHINCDKRVKKPNFDFVADVLTRGFCYSLTKSEFEPDRDHSRMCRKAGYTWEVILKTLNVDQWLFEGLDCQWDNRSKNSHLNRIRLNRERSDWNKEELKQLFSKFR